MADRLNKGVLRVVLLLLFVTGLSFVSIVLMGRLQDGRAAAQDTYQYLEVFNQALDIIGKRYVKEVDPKDLYYGAIQGMLTKLDPHSVHLPPEAFKDMKIDISGEFGGLGIEVGLRDGQLTIVSPIEDTPAWRAGIKAGDAIIKIDGVSTEGISLTDAVHKMRGKKGTPIILTVMRQGLVEPKDFKIVRDIIQVKSVKTAQLIDGKYGYVRLISFNIKSGQEVRQAMQTLTAQAGGKLAGLILDIRYNPGGPLDQALEVADAFISEGPIVSIKGRIPEDNKTFYAHKEGTFSGFPMIVIVNNGSASASEIVAACLQDTGRAVILGIKTYGKGSVQSLYTLKDGSGIKITTAYYYAPSGRSIQAEGITPDVQVEELSPEQEALLEKEREREKEMRYGEEKLPNYILHQEVLPGETVGPDKDKGAPENPKLEKQTFEEELLNDYQLRRAVELLRSWEVFQAQFKKAETK